jgi:hypothetical protein
MLTDEKGGYRRSLWKGCFIAQLAHIGFYSRHATSLPSGKKERDGKAEWYCFMAIKFHSGTGTGTRVHFTLYGLQWFVCLWGHCYEQL